MRGRMQDGRSNRISPEIAQRLTQNAQNSDTAIVLGNRAGVIEWANRAWSKVTGYALDRYVRKPVGDFLDRLDIEPDVVRFVGDCFRQGKPCEVDVPLSTPAGEPIWIHLRVEPIFDAYGEASEFIAVATDITERKRAEFGAEIGEVDLSTLARESVEKQRAVLHDMTAYDLCLAPHLPLVLADALLLKGLLERLICRAADATRGGWGTLSISTGVLGSDAPALYQGNLWRGLPHGQYAFLEVHDTGTAPHAGYHQVIEEPFLTSRYPRSSLRLASVRQLLANQGGEIRLQSSSWCGTSVVILLPYAIAHGLEEIR